MYGGKNMARARNKVIAGDYLGKSVDIMSAEIFLGNDVRIKKSEVISYNLVGSEQRKSGSSAVIRGGAGALLLGPVGLLAGLSAKNKGTYLIEMEFQDGTRSLLEVDDKKYKKIIEVLF